MRISDWSSDVCSSDLGADQLLAERGLAESRAKAQALVMAGQVFVGERRIAKPGDMLPADAAIALRGQDHPWVSRGGVQLAPALDPFAIDPAGLVCLALGASTGGFTAVLLTPGAAAGSSLAGAHGPTPRQ